MTMSDATNLPAVARPNEVMSGNFLTNPALLDHTYRVAKVFAASELVPQHMRGKVENCMVALDMARTLGENPIVVLQNIYFVSGTAGWKTQYIIGRVNRSGLIQGRINWTIEGSGKTLSVTAFATLATGERIETTVDMAMAEAEGWTKNAKYRTMPEVMLRYRSAAFLARFYLPEVMFGMPTGEELEDMKFAGNLSANEDGTYTPAPEPAKPVAPPKPSKSRMDRLAAPPITEATVDEIATPMPAEPVDEATDPETGELVPVKKAAPPKPRQEEPEMPNFLRRQREPAKVAADDDWSDFPGDN